jgi:hypothetical protein
LFLAVQAQAQVPITDEKRKLLAQLIAVMKMDAQIGKITDGILKGMQTSYPMGIAAAVDSRTDLTDQEKEKIKAMAAESYISFSERFRKRLPEVVDYQKYIQETVFPLYDKFYSEQEIKDLIAFYSTPTGQKVIDTMPELMAESQASAVRTLIPQILPLVQELTKEEFDRIAPLKPVTKTN